MTAPGEETGAAGASFNPQRLLGFLLRFWWIPLITLVLGLGVATVFVLTRPPTYVTHAQMWETVKLRLPEGSLFSEDSQTFVGTQTELLQSPTLRDIAIARLRSISNHVAIPLGPDGQPVVVPIRVSQSSKSAVYTLQATGSNPGYIRAYLNALMDVYLEYKKNIRQVVSGDTLGAISEQVQKSARDLENEQERLGAYQRSNNLAVLKEEGTVSGGYLARLKTQLSDLELENRLLKAAVNQQASNSDTNQPSLDFTSMASFDSAGSSRGQSPERQTAFRELEVLRIQRQKLSRYLKPAHPKIKRLDADIDRAQKLLEIFQRQTHQQLLAAQTANQVKIEEIQAAIKEWEAKAIVANARMAEADRLRQGVERAKGVYDRLSTLIQNVGISRNIDTETLTVLEHAGEPKRSHSQEISMAAAGGVGGLGLGLGIIFLIALLDDRFTSVREIQLKLGDGVVGQVPEMTLNGIGNGKTPLLLQDVDERHIYTESYRNLRSAIMFLAVEAERPKVLLVTSALPGEGKSSISANLAKTMAQGGARVLLIDGDLRKGALHRIMGLEGKPGLTELLQDPNTADSVIQTNSLPNLRFIPSGARIANPGDLFLRPEFTSLLTAWRSRFDYIIIDSTPVFAADDATTLAPKVDGTLFVVRSRFSGARQVREALELLVRRQAKVLGVVFNRADASARSYRYYKYAEYYPEGASAKG